MSELHRPIAVKAADICRDGGSYVLVYIDDAATELELEVPVVLGGEDRIGYECAQLLDRSSNSLRVLTWQESAYLAQQLRGVATADIAWGGESRFRECLAVLSAGGEVPDEA